MSNRYKELFYQGKTYTKKYQIDEILIENNLNWFLDCEIENVRLEILKETLIINAGIFYNGIFEYGVIRDVDWRNGVFQNGVIYNGIFKKIKVEKGIIFNGTFLNGDILFGDIRGGEFKNINISDNTNKTQSTEDISENDFEIESESTKPETVDQINNDGEEIQNKFQENNSMKILKTFEAFLGKSAIQNINEEIFKQLYKVISDNKIKLNTWTSNDKIISEYQDCVLVHDINNDMFELTIPIKYKNKIYNINSIIDKNYMLKGNIMGKNNIFIEFKNKI